MKKILYSLIAIINSISFSLTAQTLDDGLRYMDMEQYMKARLSFVSFIKKNPANAEGYYYLGDYYVRMFVQDTMMAELLDSANMLFDKGLQIDSKSALNMCGKGTVSYLRKNWGESANYFEQALKATRSKNAIVLYAIAMAYKYKGIKDIDVSIAHLERATSIDPKNTDIILALGDAYLVKDQGNASRAIKQYNNALIVNPKLAEAYIKVGVTYKLAKSYSQALTYMEEAIKADPAFSPAYRERAELFFKLKDYKDKAPEEYRKYLQMSDGDYKSKFRFAYILFANKDYDDALVQLEELRKINSKDMYIYRLSGYSNYELGFATKDSLAAQSYYVKGYNDMKTLFSIITDTSKIIPSDNMYMGKLILKAAGDTSGIKYIQKALRLDTASNYEVFNDLALYFKSKKKYLKSALFYEEYYRYKKPGLSDLVNNLGLQYYNAKEFVRADSAFAKVIAAKPEDIIGYKWRAKCNYNLDQDGKLGTGVPYCNKYIELATAKYEPKYKSDLIEAYKYLAKVAIMAKDNAKAKDQLKKVLELEPNDADAKVVLTKLK